MSTTRIAIQPSQTPDADRLAQQVADAFLAAFGDHPGFRLAHAKGIVCEGSLEPSGAAAKLSKAAHFKGGSISLVARFSNGTGVPNISDGDPRSNPKGFAIRFKLPDGRFTDIVANGQNGFVAGTPADFVGFFTAAITSPPDGPKPSPLETFLASHPASAGFLSQPNPTPASFATQPYFGNNAFVFVNERGGKQAIRYQILPVAGHKPLEPEVAAKKPPDFLIDEIKERLSRSPAEFRLVAQLAETSDPTADATQVWPEQRKKVELGLIRLTRVDPNSDQTQKKLTMDPTHLIDGIELSDDPLPAFRSQVYSISIARRL